MVTEPKVLILENFYYRLKQFEDRLREIGITDITHAVNSRECIEKLTRTKFDIAFLDYDLKNDVGFNECSANDNGMVDAEWIRTHLRGINKNMIIIIHGGNEYGASNMKKYLPQAHLIPRAWEKEQFNRVLELLNV